MKGIPRFEIAEEISAACVERHGRESHRCKSMNAGERSGSAAIRKGRMKTIPPFQIAEKPSEDPLERHGREVIAASP